jgi:hypothetical protein
VARPQAALRRGPRKTKSLVHRLRDVRTARVTTRYGAACTAVGHIRGERVSWFGHLLEPRCVYRRHPPEYCREDGTRVIHKCLACRNPIVCTVKDGVLQADGFCAFCGEPHPWATPTEQLLQQLYRALRHEPLTDAQRSAIQEEIEVLSEPVDEVTDDKRLRAGERLRSILPQELWKEFAPILRELLTLEAKRRLGLTGQ